MKEDKPLQHDNNKCIAGNNNTSELQQKLLERSMYQTFIPAIQVQHMNS
jgi:hypothetical protein